MEIGLKALQRLAKEMEDGVRFDPPINYRETDVDALIVDIRENAKDLDAVQDADAISDAGKKTLAALDAGPWQEAKEPEPAEAATEDEEEEGEKPKKGVKKMKKTVKKKAVKEAVAKTEKKVKPKREVKTKPIKNVNKANKTEEVLSLFKTGKYTMGDIKKKFGSTYYSLLGKLKDTKGIVVTVGEDKKILVKQKGK